MASTTDKLTDVRNATRPVSTTVSSSRSAGGTSLSCASLTGWPTASKVHFVTYQIDSGGSPVAGTQLDCYGIVSGSTIGSLTVVDGTDSGNSVGDIVEMLPTSAWAQDLADWGMAEHSRTGTHDATKVAMLAGAQTFTGQKTFPSPIFTGTVTYPAGGINTTDLADGAITPVKLLTGLGSSWAWTTFTPSWTNLTVGTGGNAFNTGYYMQIGKTVFIKGTMIFGTSGPSMGSNPYFAAPVNLSSNYDYANYNYNLGQTYYRNSGGAYYNGSLGTNSVAANTLKLYVSDVSSSYPQLTGLTSTIPFSWAASNMLNYSGFYEAA